MGGLGVVLGWSWVGLGVVLGRTDDRRPLFFKRVWKQAGWNERVDEGVDESVDERSIKARMTAGAVEEVDEEVNEGVDERSMFVSRDTEAEFDHQGKDEFHQQGERESTNTKSTKKKPYI